MSKARRKLQVGDYATTDFKGAPPLVKIIERIERSGSQSGVCFRVDPPLEKNDPHGRYDADWFEPAPKGVLL
jgi:hypothetical protein